MHLQARVQSTARVQGRRPAVATTRVVRRPVSVVCAASEHHEDVATAADRRGVLMGLSAVAMTSVARPATAAEGEAAPYQTFVGYATPPTSYGGYGGNAEETPKYTFEYPTGWKSEVPSKVEKGTQGVDGRVVNPRMKDQRAFVISLTRAGEDNKSFKLTDLDSTFASFAGADYNLQDAIQNANDISRVEKEVDGVIFYNYDIDSPEYRYLSSIAVKGGKVFALFVRSPTRAFKGAEEKLRHVQATFKLL